MYSLKYRRKARNYLARLPLKMKTVIVEKLHELCINPDSSTPDSSAPDSSAPDSSALDIDTLKGQEGFRLRVGQYRIIYIRKDNELIIEVVRIRTRGDVYRRLIWNIRL